MLSLRAFMEARGNLNSELKSSIAEAEKSMSRVEQLGHASCVPRCFLPACFINSRCCILLGLQESVKYVHL